MWISELEAVREEWGRLIGVCVRVDLERVGIDIGGVGRDGSGMCEMRDGDKRSNGYRNRKGSGETKQSEVGGASR